MKTMTLATFDKPEQAEPLKQRLDQMHIPSEVHSGTALKKMWFVTRHVAEVKVDVKAEDYGQAQRLLHELEVQDNVVDEAVRCPQCNSSRVEFPQFTRKFFLPNLLGLLAGLGFVEKKYYCEDCHNTWPRPDHKYHRPRTHMAPDYFLDDVPKNDEPTKPV